MNARNDILRCARDIYLEHGLKGMNLRAVARCAGVSAPAIYRHFEGKEDLLWSVCQQGHELFGRYLARGLKGRTPRERLVLTGQGYLDFALDHQSYYFIMFVAPPEHLGLETLVERNQDEGASTFQMLVDRVRECQDAGALAAGDPMDLAVSIWAHVHGLVTLYQRVPRGRPPTEQLGPPAMATEASFRDLYERSVSALLDGLAAPTR